MHLFGLGCEDELLPRGEGKKAHSAHTVFSGAWLRQKTLTTEASLRLDSFTDPSILFQILKN